MEIRTKRSISMKSQLGLSLRNFEKPLRYLFSLLLIVMYLVATAFFSQGHDISHTVLSSYALLNGQILEFYDYNKIVLLGNDYLPPVYIIFSIWMAPLFLTGLSSAQYTAVGSPIEIELLPFELFWAKLALMVAFALTVIVFSNIAKILFISDKREASMTTIVFATSPIAFFAFGIFNQYDIFGVLLTLLAILNILRGRWLLFAVFFGLAATFKFFAILLALPLTLLFVPTWRRRIATGLVILMTPVLFAIPYISSVPFREGVLRLVSDRASSGSFLSVIVFTVVIYGAINLWAWHLSRTKQDPNKPFVIISVATYALLFNSVNFHPQWLIIITPFLALAVGYVRHVKLFLLAETFAFSMFTWYVLVTYKDNVDGTMVMNGPLSSVFENPMFPVSVFYPPIPSGIGLLVFKAMILALPALIFYFGLKNRKAEEGVIMTVTLGLRSISPLFLVLIPSLIPVLV